MTDSITPFGTVQVYPSREALFQAYLDLMIETASIRPGAGIALTGGSTPKAFYAWAREHLGQQTAPLQTAVWTVSDERHVPSESEDSNWGTAWRAWLGNHLDLDPSLTVPWPTKLAPEAGAKQYAKLWHEAHADLPLYDLCTLGMGNDCHTASLFPACPLLADDGGHDFAATEWPGKGWRLTITPTGLSKCDQIVVLVTGASKVDALKAVFNQPVDLAARPIQVLAPLASRVTWMLDAEAGEAFNPS